MKENKFKQTDIGKIPEDWEVKELKEVAEVITGFPFKSENYSLSRGTKVVRGENLNDRKFRWDTTKKWIEISEQLKKFLLKENLALLGMDGAVGKNRAITKKEDLPLLLAQRVSAVISKRRKSQGFINQVLMSDLFFNYCERIKTGTTIAHISKTQIENFKLPFPKSPSEQQIIAQVLSSLDSKIELNNKMNKNLEEMGQTIFKKWFVDFEFPNENGKPYKSSDGKMIESEFGMIPEGWKVSKIGEIVSPEKYAIVDGPFGTQMKIEEYKEEGVPIIEMGFLEGYPFYKPFKKFISEEKFEEVKRSAVKKGDIVISKTGTLGLLGIMTDLYEKAIIVSRLAKITPNTEKISRYYLFFILKKLADEGYWNQISSGSTMPLFNLTHIKNKQIVLPKKRWMDIFETTISNFYDQILNNLKENQTLSLIRDTLLPKLMSGEIRVI